MNRNSMKAKLTSIVSDQQKDIPQPPLQKPYDENSVIIDLPHVDKSILTKDDIFQCILDRKSHRVYLDEEVSLEELSYLLKMTSSIKEIRGNNYVGLRPVPSAGGRHPFETYLAITKVEGLPEGIYRYLPIDHKLLLVKKETELDKKMAEASNNQKFVQKAAVTFIWACIPYRTEWRYVDRSYKLMLLDAGHICQALYLACETIGLGTCAIASYDQKLTDKLIQVDGEEEFVVYVSPVGRV